MILYRYEYDGYNYGRDLNPFNVIPTECVETEKTYKGNFGWRSIIKKCDLDKVIQFHGDCTKYTLTRDDKKFIEEVAQIKRLKIACLEQQLATQRDILKSIEAKLESCEVKK